MDLAKYGISWIICFSLLFSSFTDGLPLGSYDDDLKIPKRCPDCKADIPGLRYRRAGEGGINFADIARDFMLRGGAQALAELLASEDKVGVLKRILGAQVAASFVGQGALSSLLSGLMSGSRGSSRTGSGSGGRAPPSSGPAPTMPPGVARFDPPGVTTQASNPDDTEY
ncbi:hypothetical protein RvY_05749 [Ramazzottius varieornatus]|uniref:Uncharacterized protein n=1 Tax=Ramazzottius varieornatus TaxID=947166 RepID=A0A1D1V1P9_RAMVA|nr:hypothetical protein RvY_05749 [Ramazzottius varieornatus]